MPKAQETILEIDLRKLKHNFQFIKSKLTENTMVIAVVKAFAYGSDAETIATHLQDLNVNYFAVAYASEGVALRKAGIYKPILVLHPQTINFKTLLDNCLEPNLYSFKVLKEFITVAQTQKQKNYPVHIKFNTGLNRLGFTHTDVAAITTITNATNSIKVKSIFSHLGASEDENERNFTQKQIALFKEIEKNFKEKSIDKPFAHIANTSGILNYPEAHLDAVRTGIGLYGFGNSETYTTQLKPIAALKSVISQIHTITPGESVGYNRGYIATSIVKTATIPIGHADGISRMYGKGNAYVIINEQKAPIIGNVCMDMIMVNVTNISCAEGDEVIIFDGVHTAAQFAATGNSISYEIITAIAKRVKRVFVR